MTSNSKKSSHEVKQPSKHCSYVPTTKNILSYFPRTLVPYGELIRLDNGGYSNIIFHLASGASLAASMQRVQAGEFFIRFILLSVAFVPVRYVNLIWNDIADADFDRLVPRTQNRPIACGAVLKFNASIFMILLCLCVLVELWFPPAIYTVHAIPFASIGFIYPLSKRFTNYPQLFFGLLSSQASVMGAAIFGMTPFIHERCERLPRDLSKCCHLTVRSDDWLFVPLFALNVA